MALRNILQYDDEALHKVCREVTDVNDRIRTLIDDLTDTLREAGGVGLAAPQVGVLRRVAVVELDEDHHYEMVNPRIVEEEGEQYGEEGCLSVDGMCGDVKRPLRVKVACLDRNGNPVEYEGTELLARAFCHEIDHLDGIIYTQKADNIRPVEYGAPEDSDKQEELASSEGTKEPVNTESAKNHKTPKGTAEPKDLKAPEEDKQ